MNIRQTICLMVLSVGVVLIAFSFHLLGFISDKQAVTVGQTASPLSPTEHLPRQIQPAHNGPIWILVGGISLFLLGGYTALIYRSK